jgi:hypothetical protein
VQLINTEGMAFIGPGSEWFWTAVSGLILVVTFVAIYRQLRIMRSASAFEQLDAFERELGSERMQRYQLATLVALRDGVDPARLSRGTTSGIWAFWEKTGALSRHGHLDPKLLFEGSGTEVLDWWQTFAPFANRVRAEAKSPAFLENFEWLAGRMAELARHAGTASDLDDPAYSGEARIGSLIERLRLEEALRSVQLASPVAPSPAPRRRRAHGVSSGQTTATHAD